MIHVSWDITVDCAQPNWFRYNGPQTLQQRIWKETLFNNSAVTKHVVRARIVVYRTDGVFCLDFLQISTEIPFVQ